MAGKYVCWGFTLNNYTDQELVMIRTFPEFIRECIWEPEKGEEGTPHIQGFLRLKTQQRVSFLNKNFLSRAHYVGLGTEEYKENMKKYAQKQDSTAEGPVVQQRQSEPVLFPAIVPEMIVKEMLDAGINWSNEAFYWVQSQASLTFDKAYDIAAKRLVTKYRVETIVCRPDIRACVRLFMNEIHTRIEHKREDGDDTTTFGSGNAQELPRDGRDDD